MRRPFVFAHYCFVLCVFLGLSHSGQGILWEEEWTTLPAIRKPLMVNVDGNVYVFHDDSSFEASLKKQFSVAYVLRNSETTQVLLKLASNIDINLISLLAKLEWSKIQLSGSLPEDRVGSCAYYYKQTIHIFGGIQPRSAEKEKHAHSLSLNDYTWLPPMDSQSNSPQQRMDSFCHVSDRYMYLLGGIVNGEPIGDLWRFDIESNLWSNLEPSWPAFAGRKGMASALVRDRIFVFGGCNDNSCFNDLWAYSLTKNLWSVQQLRPSDQMRSFAGMDYAHAVVGNTLYLYGHYNTQYAATYQDVFTISLDTFVVMSMWEVPMSPMSGLLKHPEYRRGGRFLSLASNIIYAGGEVPCQQDVVWVFNTEDNAWTASSSDFYPPTLINSTLWNHNETHIALYGGWLCANSVKPSGDIWMYNSNTNSWITFAASSFELNGLPYPDLTSPRILSRNNSLVVIGYSNSLVQIWEFDLSILQWMPIDNMRYTDDGRECLPSRAFFSTDPLLIWCSFGTYDSTPSSESQGVWKFYSLDSREMKDAQTSPHLVPTSFTVDSFAGEPCLSNIYYEGAISHDIWCLEKNSSTWIRRVPSTKIQTSPLYIFSFHHQFWLELSQSKPLQLHLHIYDQLSSEIQSQEFMELSSQTPSMPALSVYGSQLFIFGASLYRDANHAILKTNIPNFACLNDTPVIKSGKEIESLPRSKTFRYLPGSSCMFRIRGFNQVLLEYLDRSQSWSATISSTLDKFHQFTYKYNSRAIDEVTKWRALIDDEFSFLFELSGESLPSLGASLFITACKPGFEFDSKRCVCPSDKYITSFGDCANCPNGAKQPLPDQMFCQTSLPERGVLDSAIIKSSSYLSITTLPSVYLASAITIQDKTYLFGGKSLDKDEQKWTYLPLSTMYIQQVSDPFRWSMIRTLGITPISRHGACTFRQNFLIMMIGGLTEILDDGRIYQFDTRVNKWAIASQHVLRIYGSSCHAYMDKIWMYGGFQDGSISSFIFSFDKDQDELNQITTNGPLRAYASFAVWDDHLFMFGGTDGLTDYDDLWALSFVQPQTPSMLWILKYSTVQPSYNARSYTKELARQQAVTGQIGKWMIIFGGLQEDEVLHSIVLISLDDLSLNIPYKSSRRSNDGPSPRYGSASVVHGSEFSIFSGLGDNGDVSLKDEWIWSLDLLSWKDSSIFYTPQERENPIISDYLGVGFILYGGSTREGLFLGDLWIFREDTWDWAMLSSGERFPAPSPRRMPTINVVSDRVFLVGGMLPTARDPYLWIFNITERKWSFLLPDSWKSDDTMAYRYSSTSVSFGSQLWMWGGLVQSFDLTRRLASNYVYIVDTNKITSMFLLPDSARPITRAMHVSGVYKQSFCISGGKGYDGTVLDDFWCFDITSKRWTMIPILPSLTFQRYGAAGSFLYDGYIVFGGFDQLGHRLDDGVMYQFASKEVIRLPFMGHAIQLSGQADSIVARDGYLIFYAKTTKGYNGPLFYRPGFCTSSEATYLQGSPTPQRFNDGSDDGYYLTMDGCAWSINQTTWLRVNYSLYEGDRLLVYSDDAPGRRDLLANLTGDGSSFLVSETRSFLLYSNGTQRGSSWRPKYGFQVDYADCPNSVDGFDRNGCKCGQEEFYDFYDGMCHPCHASPEKCKSSDVEEDYSKTTIAITVSIVGSASLCTMVFLWNRQHRTRRLGMRYKDVDNPTELIDQVELSIDKSLGNGPFGEAYWATFRNISVSVQFVSTLGLESTTVSRIFKDFEKICEIRHPNLARIHAIGSSPNHVFYAHRIYANWSLYDFLHENKRSIDLPTQLRLIVGVAKGLLYLHGQKDSFVIRSMSSRSILVDDSLTPALSDYGLLDLKTRTGTSWSWSGWLAPEVLLGENPTQKSDVYSFGVIVKEIITRELPYATLASVYCMMSKQRQDLSCDKLNQSFGGLHSIVKICCASSASDRPTAPMLSKLIQPFDESAKRSRYLAISQSPTRPQQPLEVTGLVLCAVSGIGVVWESNPIEAKEAMLIFGGIMHRLLEKNRGYLFKKDTSSVALAFQSCLAGMQFCLDLQECLNTADWTSQLLQYPSCREEHDGLFRGLRVRLAMNFGSVSNRIDPGNGCIEYYGRLLKASKEILRKTRGGQLLVSHSVFEIVKNHLRDLGSPFYTHRGSIQFGKWQALEPVYEFLPNSLADRSMIFGPITQRSGSMSAHSEHDSGIIGGMGALGSHDSAFDDTSIPFPSHASLPNVVLHHSYNSADDSGSELDSGRYHSSTPGFSFEIMADEFSLSLRDPKQGHIHHSYSAMLRGRKTIAKRLYGQRLAYGTMLDLIEICCHAKNMSHPNLVKVYGVCLQSPYVALMEEFVSGGNLEDMITSRQHSFQAGLMTSWTEQICLALCYLHTHSPVFTHGSVHARNILFDQDQRIKLSGHLMPSLYSKSPVILRRECAFFVAPEVLDGQAMNPLADMYSAGVCVWAMAARRLCREDDQVAHIAKQPSSPQEWPDLTAFRQAQPLLYTFMRRLLGPVQQRPDSSAALLLLASG